MNELTIQISKTANGLQDYVQITMPDQVSLNIVLIADTIKVQDQRENEQHQCEHRAGRRGRRAS